ncbi:[protein-PII] uridylyltransferase [Porticoccus sp. W117]|uniref:[protein-PII] uridylyltransferase n=1 Tax=Porticoccus sp. W117 TaxID=3054777 RepID=UPI00259AA7E9|nr:[protein-PII] uridylyltransferase [Porticoccus sp. W117]MDM3872216.1 [protein-PII] uridylyltransferase [Porticoccus sp. W117]
MLQTQRIQQNLADGNLLAALNTELQHHQQQQEQQFRDGVDIRTLISERAHFFDQLLALAWQQLGFPDDISLIAVGGYGRGELHPQSDIDLLLLHGDKKGNRHRELIEQFLQLLWDLKLNVGHSVRTLKECIQHAKQDITVATSLMETRTIAGDESWRQQLQEQMAPGKLWPAADFFMAKRDEQIARHQRHGINEYDLEPNVKKSPGGLRDIQTIMWVAKRYYKVESREQLRSKALFSDSEYRALQEGEELLWRVRFALHNLTGRPQEVLHFDRQRQLAELFGYQDNERLAVEQFMQDYYRTVMQLRLINEVVMRHLQETIVDGNKQKAITSIDDCFQVRGKLLETTHKKVFSEHPSALLEVFIHLSKLDVDGIRPTTVRQIQAHSHLIDDKFRSQPRNQQLFMELFRQPYGLSTTLQRMTRYGILGTYLPEFGQIIGQMQHDLFHIYPVDVHTLQVVKNIRRLSRDKAAEQFPLAAELYRAMDDKELLLITALYHDIGKGRGGNHSLLGAVDMREFANRHSLAESDGDMMVWLVESHLLMSRTSQKEDISDPEVINKFASKVGSQRYLDMLYVLTVADVNATNPELWNSWKASLMNQLYHETSRALARGKDDTLDQQQRIADNRAQALQKLHGKLSEEQVSILWNTLGDDYFLRETATDIAWHTEAIQQYDNDQPMVLIKSVDSSATEGATQIFIRIRDRDNSFAAMAAALDQLGLNIQGARLYNSSDNYTLDTFYVLDHNHQPITSDPEHYRRIRETILTELQLLDSYSEVVSRRTSRRLKQFPVATTTKLSQPPSGDYSILEVTTADRSGLLALIGRIFVELGIRVQNAKISTLGERVEDVFYISDLNNQPITDPELGELLQQNIRQRIDSQI